MTSRTITVRSNTFPFLDRKRTHTIFQTEAAECGLACLGMIAGHYGYHLGLPELRRRFPISQKGCSFSELVKIAGHIKLASRAVKLELDSLEKLRTPCILHWEFNHFVVLDQIKSGHAYIHDPAQGLRKIPMAEVSRKFTGVALELWPLDDYEKIDRKPTVSVSRLIGSIKGLHSTFFQVFAFSIALEIFVLAAPFYVQWTVDHALSSADMDLLALLAMSFMAIVIFQHFTSAMRSWLLMHLSAVWNIRWRARIFSHLIRLPIDYFSRRHLGDVLSKFGAVDDIQRTVTTSFLEGTIDGVMTLLTLFLMFLYSPTLAFIVIATAFFYGVIRMLWFSPLRIGTHEHMIHAAKQDSHFLETLRGIRAIKLFSREDVRRDTWLSLLADQINAEIRVQRLTLIYKHSNGLLFGLENIAVVYLGSRYVIDSQLTIGSLMAFIAYKSLFQSRMCALIDKMAEYRMLSVQADRLSDIALSEKEVIDFESLENVRTPANIDPAGVEVSHLSFRYGEFEPLVLDNVSFAIQPGESVAITGVSGSGKSTLANLMLGILPPTTGTIELHTEGKRHHGVGALRHAFGTVMQDDILLTGSLFENISFFDPDADMAWVVACAKMACIHDEIESMPMRYNTLTGDMGNILSGGQKQRVLLARALYKKPACLLLDEATSHLDIACEKQVNAAVKSLQMTRIIIAHRPETIASADRVLHLEKGRLVNLSISVN